MQSITFLASAPEEQAGVRAGELCFYSQTRGERKVSGLTFTMNIPDLVHALSHPSPPEMSPTSTGIHLWIALLSLWLVDREWPHA